MKISLLVLLPAFGFTPAPGDETWNLLNSNSVTVTAISRDRTIPGRSVLFMEMPFNSASWKNPDAARLLKGTIVESVELVSTTYSENSAFDQEQLDHDRLQMLKAKMPELLSDPRTEWKRVRETAAKTKEEARKQFHGFVLICREPPSRESMAKEIESLEAAFKPAKTNPAKKGIIADKKTESAGSSPARISTIKNARKRVYLTEAGTISSDTSASYKGTGDDLSVVSYSLPPAFVYPDTAITATLNRNKQWKDMLVVCDVTGSMSPYTGQLLAWFRLNTLNNRINSFVFFNDGDMKPDASKVAGSTGGLYSTVASNFDTVMSTAVFAMRQGYGGDAPENNVEAVSYGLKNYGDAKEIVMIADNWATPRDLALAGSIDRPVHIIVCGGAYGINPAYLDLARKTGGSVHTMEKDLTNLAKMYEGETVTVGPYSYLLKDGKFIRTGERFPFSGFGSGSAK